ISLLKLLGGDYNDIFNETVFGYCKKNTVNTLLPKITSIGLASSFISLVILDTFKGNISMLVIIILIGTLLCVVLGTIVGLLSQNIAQTSILGLPIFIIFIMGPMLQEMVKNEFIIKVVKLLPTNHVMEALQKVIKGEGFIAIQEQ
ncbi:hypothetical protein ACT4UM_26195, partial [Bacillus sp. SS-TM]